ncbi:LAFA_0G05974g1_1 [Lachancea sp. 'fantastica']|nr:LAFA_0G05974g1_1 [Lachancea sp. 'fantastica']
MSDYSVRSDILAHSIKKRELQNLPRTMATSNILKEDSDDENMLGPPQLSNFGSALVSDKENIEPGGRVYKHGLQVERTLGKEVVANKKNNDTLGSYFNAPGSHTTTYSEGHSDSTMLGNFKDNQQSMTTFNSQTQADSGKTYTFNDNSPSSSKLRNLQQTLKDELSTRSTRRRNRRFISSRLSLLGPAQRASSATTTPDRSVNGDDSQSYQPFLFNNPAKAEDKSSYSVFHDPRQSVLSPSNDYKNTAAAYENIDFGDLNPYQYLKKHNLPTTELPNISRVYFERQKGQNRSIALRKSNLTKDAIQSRLASASLSNSSFLKQNEPLKREHSFTKREPRRKLSSGPANNISKALSSPVFDAAATRKALDGNDDQNTHDEKYGIVKTPHKHSDGYFQRREVLSNIDINSSSAKQPLQKKFKPANNRFENPEVAKKGQILSVDQPRIIGLPHNSPILSEKKHVEILEPARSAGHVSHKPSTAGSEPLLRRRPTVCVNGIEYEKLELLGRGGTSKVYKVRNSSNNKVYALKRVSFDEFDDGSLDGFRGEIELLKKLETKPRVVRLIDHEMGSGILHVVMECGDHDLSQTLAQRSDMNLDVEFVRYHSQEMLKCVKVVHEAGIVHSDLKPANFVFVKGILKIIDFGIANAVPEHTVNIYRETQFGTPNYMAPETLVAMNFTSDQASEQNKWKVGKPSDIWSCGCIIYQMIYGRPPYGGFQGQNRLLAIMNPEVKIVYPEKTSSGDIVPKTAIDTMKACLERSPSERWTVDEVLNGSFVNPVAVTHFFIRDLIKNSVKYGFNKRELSSDKIEELADDVWRRLGDFRL